MTEPEQIPHLIKLLDDESFDVRKVVAHELSAFGPNLKLELKKIGQPLTPSQREHIEKIMEGYKRTQLKRTWLGWLKLEDRRDDLAVEYKRLETALALFSKFLSCFDSDTSLVNLLDGLADAYNARHKKEDCVRLARFLFKEKGLRGDENDYYNPQNENLHYVITKKKGVPISLAAVYMLVGMRLGIRIEGCHFPGHFLARVKVNGENMFVDCFNQGQIIDEKDLLSIREGTLKGMGSILNEKMDVDSVVRCYLANLIRSYQVREDEVNSRLFISMFREMDIQEERKMAGELIPEDIIHFTKPAYQAGQCVQHLRYGYRGIIVDVNQVCQATDNWYYGNQTQPKRNQPWYHVLVHGSDQVTYVAQNNLAEDVSKEKVKHPLLSYFFERTTEGRYIRNKNPWPETDF